MMEKGFYLQNGNEIVLDTPASHKTSNLQSYYNLKSMDWCVNACHIYRNVEFYQFKPSLAKHIFKAPVHDFPLFRLLSRLWTGECNFGLFTTIKFFNEWLQWVYLKLNADFTLIHGIKNHFREEMTKWGVHYRFPLDLHQKRRLFFG